MQIIARVTAVIVAGAGALAGAAIAHAAPASPVTTRQVAYVGDSMGEVEIVDWTTAKHLQTLQGFGAPTALAVTPDGSRLYVVDSAGTTVRVLDTATNATRTTITGLNHPDGIAVNPNGREVYVANYGSGTLSVVDTATDTVSQTVPVGTHPHGVTLSPDGTRVYVAIEGAGTVAVVGTADHAVDTTYTVGKQPYATAVTPDGGQLYVATDGTDTVSVVDTASGRVDTVYVGSDPSDVVITPDGHYAYVAVGGGTVMIDTATRAVTELSGGGLGPNDVAVTPDGSHYWQLSLKVVSVQPAGQSTVVGSFYLDGSAEGVAFATIRTVGPVPRMALKVEDGAVSVDASTTTRGWYQTYSYTVDWGDGSTPGVSGDPYLGHVYAHAGTYPVTLTVTDSTGATVTAVAEVTVHPWIGQFDLLTDSNDRYVSADAAGAQPLIGNRTQPAQWESFDLIDVDGTTVALRAVINGWYVSVGPDNRLTANASTVDGATRFQIVPGQNGSFSLLDAANARYVSSNNASAPLTADRTVANAWEMFHKVPVATANTALRAAANGRYVTAEAGGAQPLIANRTAIGPWEQFAVVDAGDGYVALLSHADNRYVTAESGGAGSLIANRTAIGPWEKFTRVRNADGTLSLLSLADNRYVTAEAGGNRPLIANRTAIGPWEEFTDDSWAWPAN